jgi:hypothetical protein
MAISNKANKISFRISFHQLVLSSSAFSASGLRPAGSGTALPFVWAHVPFGYLFLVAAGVSSMWRAEGGWKD